MAGLVPFLEQKMFFIFVIKLVDLFLKLVFIYERENFNCYHQYLGIKSL